MIYTYRHLPHKIESFHQHIAHFFEQLFHHNPAAYDETLLLRADFISIVNQSPKLLRGNLIEITRVYHELPDPDKAIMQTAFQVNNNIQTLCNDVHTNPIKFEAFHENIRKLLKDFFTMLWDGYPQNQLVEDEFGTIQEHFTAFTNKSHQKALICPFCGINKLKPSGGIHRDAYDHYIAKATYPFVSVNFQNLFPACHECNSDEKKAIDTLYDGTIRRQTLFPYDITYNPEQLTVTITPAEPYNPVNLKTLLNEINWDYGITLAGGHDVRLAAWDGMYHIKRRYKENLKVYETEWFEELIKKYKRERVKGTSFINFRNEILEDAKYLITNSGMGILKHSYFSFIFSINNIEQRLNEALA